MTRLRDRNRQAASERLRLWSVRYRRPALVLLGLAFVLAFAVMAFTPLPGFGLVGCPLIGFGLGALVIWITSEPESPLTPPNNRDEQG